MNIGQNNSLENLSFGTLRVKLPYDKDKQIIEKLKAELPKGTKIEMSNINYQFRDGFHRHDIESINPKSESKVAKILNKLKFDFIKVSSKTDK